MRKRYLLVPIALLIGLCVYLSVTQDEYSVQPTTTVQTQAATENSQAQKKPEIKDIDIAELHKLVNDYRVKNGKTPLAYEPKLALSAQDKCNDMVAKDYWSHNAPDGTTPWHFIKQYLPNYIKAGENLAERYKDARGVYLGWENSQMHNKNLVDGEFNSVGYSVCSDLDTQGYTGVSIIVVQHLAKI